MKFMTEKKNTYERITETIIAMLEKGVIPWRKSWRVEPPRNLISGKAYRGFNAMLLWSVGSAYYLTFNQAKAIGGHVKAGATGFPIIVWKIRDEEEEEDATGAKKKNSAFLRHYTVFRIEDVQGIPEDKLPTVKGEETFVPVDRAEKIIANMPNRPEIRHEGQRAFYRPSADSVTMPLPSSFDKPEEYYSTLFHELTHATGHESRLGRKTLESYAPFGSESYSREELVAEIGAGFLCASCGIEAATLENSAAYVQGWLKVLKNDNHAVIVAAGQAQKAADFILGDSSAEEEDLASEN